MKLFHSRKVAALAAAAIIVSVSAHAAEPAKAGQPGSHLYTQTNETVNKIIHYARNADGTLTEVERVSTGGRGTNGYKFFTGQNSAPDTLVSAAAITMSADHSMLFAVNAADSSVSSFAVGKDGKLQLRDRKPTGEAAPPTAVAYNAKAHTLYVVHQRGPNHIRSFTVVDGMLTATGKAYTLNTPQFNDRIPTQIVSSPDGRFLLANMLANKPPPKPVLANDETKDGLMVFPVNPDGTLGKVVINDAGGVEPFGLTFLNGSNDTFVNTLSDSSGVVLSKLDPDGKVTNSPLAKVDVSGAPKGGPAETCWVALSPDNRFAYAANYGLSNLTSFAIENGTIRTAADNIGRVTGDGKFTSAAGVVSSAPLDAWASKDGFLYQLYPNASQLVAYRMNGAQLEKVGSYPVPYNMTVGLTGY